MRRPNYETENMGTFWYLGITILLIGDVSAYTRPSSAPEMSCSYGLRGSLTATCFNAKPSLFRSTDYSFDTLDETLRCINCTLTVIESNTFDISGNIIKTLDLTASKISILKARSFMGLMFLKSLFLPDNYISTVPSDTFMGINKLTYLDMHNNSITELVTGAFKELVNLERLDLSFNAIQSIKNGTFDRLESLVFLNLSHNNIASVTGSLHGLTNINTIILGHNKLSKLENGDFDSPLEELLQLDLHRNDLHEITDNTFLNFPQLMSLDLSTNPIAMLAPEAFRGLKSLKVLDLSACSVGDIPKKTFRYLQELRQVNLAYNRLASFTPGLFTSLPELRSLNLSGNGIKTLEAPGVFKLTNLHTLDLSRNSLADLDFKLLVDLAPNLAGLILTGNTFPCYLGREMEDFFEADNLHYDLGEEYRSKKCDETRPTIPPILPDDQIPSEKPAKREHLKKEEPEQSSSSSNGHEYLLYIFIVVSLGLSGFLFYGQHRMRREIERALGHSENVAEVHLLSTEDI